MICKWIANNPLTLSERKKIREAIDLNMSYREIGLYVGRHKSTILKEAKRLGKAEDYDPEKAQRDFERKQKSIGKKK